MAARLTFGELRRGAVAWVREDFKRSLRVGAISFGVSWLVNFIVITTWGAAFGNVIGGATDGTEFKGAMYIAVMSLTVTAFVVHGLEAGWADLRRSFTVIPSVMARLFRRHGVRMWSIVFWGGAVTLLTSGVLDPTLSAALGIGFLAFAPTAVTGILGHLLTEIWRGLVGFFAPRSRPRPTGLGAELIGVIGAAVGFLVASQATETAFQLIAAGVLAALSYLTLINSASRPAKAAAFVLLGLAFWIGGEGIAAALGGCCDEAHHHPLDPGWQAAGLSTVAGLAGGVAGVVGAGVGAALAANPTDPSTWDDGSDDGGGPTLTNDPVPDGPTRTSTITLTGDEARAAWEAYRRSLSEGGQVDIPLPENEQWGTVISADDGTRVTDDHLGTRGRITGIGAVVEGDDGSISISVDVTTYNPPAGARPAAPAPPPPTTPPPALDDATPTAEGPGTLEDAPPSPGGDAEVAPPPPPPETPTPGPTPPVPEVVPPTETPPEPEQPAAPPPRLPMPDGSSPGAFADWVSRTAEGTLPPGDVRVVDGLIRGDDDAVTISGQFGGRFGPLLRKTESRTDGVAVKFPTGDQMLVRVRDGRIEVKHEASFVSLFADAVADTAAEAGLKLPRVEDAMTAVRKPLDAFNRAVESSGRVVEAVTRNPDGSITMRLRPR